MEKSNLIWIAFVEMAPMPNSDYCDIAGAFTTVGTLACSKSEAEDNIRIFLEQCDFLLVNVEDICLYCEMPPNDQKKKDLSHLKRQIERTSETFMLQPQAWIESLEDQ